MKEKQFLIKHNGLAFCEPVGLVQKNAIVKALEGCTNVEVIPIEAEGKPQLQVYDGGRK